MDEPHTPSETRGNPFEHSLRNDSLISVDTVYMPEQPNLFSRQRSNSNASIASSIFSEAQRPQIDNYNFSNQFDDQLFTYYIAYSQQPNITPFDIRFPPSGILSLISKLYLDNLVIPNNIPILNSIIDPNNTLTNTESDSDLLLPYNRNKLLTLIRLRLIQICNVNLNTSTDFNPSYNDILPISRTNSMISSFSTDRVLPNFDSQFQQQQQQQQQHQHQPPPQSVPLKSTSWLNISPALYSTRVSKQNEDTQDLPSKQRPSLNLNLPLTKPRPMFNQQQQQQLPQLQQQQQPPSLQALQSFPSPMTPNGSSSNIARNNYPRAARSASLTNAGPTYFNIPRADQYNTHLNNNHGHLHGNHHNHTHNQSQFLNPTLNGIVSWDSMSPFEQGFPSPMYPQSNNHTSSPISSSANTTTTTATNTNTNPITKPRNHATDQLGEPIPKFH